MKVNRIIKRSLEYAYNDSLASYDFVVENAKEMDSTVMNNHIKLFVNEYTLNLGRRGRKLFLNSSGLLMKKVLFKDSRIKFFSLHIKILKFDSVIEI